MKILCAILIAFSTFLTTFIDPQIKGSYRVEYDQQFHNNIDFTSISFSDSTYEKTFKNGNKTQGKIIRSYIENKKEHRIRLVDNHFDISRTGLDSLIKKSFGVPIVEFLENKSDTINFRSTYVWNLHITLNEGKLIRQNK